MKMNTVFLAVMFFVASFVVFFCTHHRFVKESLGWQRPSWENNYRPHRQHKDDISSQLTLSPRNLSRYKIDVYSEIDRPVVLANSENNVVVRVGLISSKAPDNHQRIPLNLAIVLDRSGSMGGQKLEDAKQGAINIIERLNSQDIVSLVVFDSNAQVIVPAQALRNKDHLIQMVRSI
ncbi:MAG: VWA domain-containing protein, partial [Candidatus Omnitrophica bacterium]|nr:VWA domain-containing protein [Candidatus Omnitrophota bacterium]